MGGGEGAGALGAELEGAAQRRVELVAAAGDVGPVELELVAVEVVELLGVAQDGVEALALDGGEHLGDPCDDRRVVLGRGDLAARSLQRAVGPVVTGQAPGRELHEREP